MPNLEIEGVIVDVGATTQVSERFKKREFVLDITEDVNGNSYPNFAKMQAVQNRCELLDQFRPGDRVKVSFNVRGNKWEKDGKVSYITQLDAWRVEAVAQQYQSYQPAAPQPQQQYQAPQYQQPAQYQQPQAQQQQQPAPQFTQASQPPPAQYQQPGYGQPAQGQQPQNWATPNPVPADDLPF